MLYCESENLLAPPVENRLAGTVEFVGLIPVERVVVEIGQHALCVVDESMYPWVVLSSVPSSVVVLFSETSM